MKKIVIYVALISVFLVSCIRERKPDTPKPVPNPEPNIETPIKTNKNDSVVNKKEDVQPTPKIIGEHYAVIAIHTEYRGYYIVVKDNDGRFSIKKSVPQFRRDENQVDKSNSGNVKEEKKAIINQMRQEIASFCKKTDYIFYIADEKEKKSDEITKYEVALKDLGVNLIFYNAKDYGGKTDESLALEFVKRSIN